MCKLTKVEFNSLNLVVSIDSWVAVLDFFGIAGDDLPEEHGHERHETSMFHFYLIKGECCVEMWSGSV